MKTYDKVIGKNEYLIEEFDSVLELQRINASRLPTKEWVEHNATLKHEKIDSDWTGVESVQEAYDLLTGGWEQATEKVADLVDKVAKTGKKSKMQQENNVYGFVPNVPLAIMNVPNSMINITRTAMKSKVVTILYDNTASCSVSSEQMINAGRNLVETIINLESSGYRVNLKVLTSNCEEGRIELGMTNVKNANQPLNLKKMMFPMAHSAWLRVVGFDWQDKSPICKYKSGRGYPYYVMLKDYNVDKNEIHQILGKDAYIITYKDASYGTDYIKQQLIGKEVA